MAYKKRKRKVSFGNNNVVLSVYGSFNNKLVRCVVVWTEIVFVIRFTKHNGVCSVNSDLLLQKKNSALS
jgi:hypothetical protein